MDQNNRESISIHDKAHSPKPDDCSKLSNDIHSGQIEPPEGDSSADAQGMGPDFGHWKRSFFTIAAGQTVSLIGSSAVQFALIWWLTSETKSALMLSLAGLLAFLPQMILGPFAGVWIDRMKRKRVIIAADLFMGAVAGALALLFFLGKPPYWVVCAAIGMRSVGNVFHTPAMQAAVPMLVPQDQLVRTNGFSQFLQSGAFMLGPVLGAAMYASLTFPVILLTDLLGAIVASATVAAVRIPDPERAPQQAAPHFFGEMKEGARLLLKDRPIVVITLAATASMLFYLPLSSLYPLLTATLNGNAWHAGVIELVYALGMALCSIFISVHGQIKNKFRTIHIALFLLGVTSFVCGILPAQLSYFWAFALMCTLMGGSGTLFHVPFTAYLQQSVPPEAQGRAFSLIGSLMSFAMPLGLIVAGPVAQTRGVMFWFLVSGVATMAVSILSALFVRALGRKKGTQAPEENQT